MVTKSLRLAVAGAVAAASLTGAGVTAAVATTSYNGCTVASTPVLAMRTHGTRTDANVKAMQCLINKHAGRNVIATDGRFGPLTDAAVRSFQQRKGLEVDGVVGPRTWGALKAKVGSTTPTTKPTTKPTQPVTGARQKAVSYAESKVGNRYVWGAEGPNTFDCSGLTWASMRAAGINRPREGARDQGAHAPRRGLSRSQLQPGDLVVANDGSHIAMYVGNGYIVHAVNPRRGVVKEKLDGGWFQRSGVNYVSYF